MSPDASTYRTLGLQPGADAAAVEAAYRRLIKLHHPDREGGDSKRAAEINRAYRHLRDARRSAVPPQGTGAAPPRQRRARTGIGGWLALAMGVGLLVLIVGALDPQHLSRPFPALGEPLRHEASRAAASGARAMRFSEMPLDSDSIDRAIAEARRVAGQGDPAQLAGRSRACHAALRRDPALTRLDQCVAFDEAVVALMKDDMIGQSGQFSTSAVTGRQLASSRLFTGDYLEMESRLDQIRARVEFMLAPADPPPPRGDEPY